MAIVPFAEIAETLRCPSCRGELAANGQGLRCSNADCSTFGKSFPKGHGVPVLVDFGHSILRRSDLDADVGVERRRKPGRLFTLLRPLLAQNERAAANAARLLSMLREERGSPLVLVVGGGAVGSGAEALYEAADVRLVGFDLYASPLVQLIADAHQMPFADGTFDAVWVQAVLEHVLDPQAVAGEVERVLRPGGLVYAETPFLQAVHEGPYDFMRFTDSGHRWLFRRFELIDSGVVLGPFAQLLWSINHSARSLFRSHRAGFAAEILFSWLKYLDRLVPDSFARDAASALFFLGRKSGTSLSPQDIVNYYRGAQRRA